MTPEEADSVLNKAKIEGKGIDAARLASELKLMAQGASLERQTGKNAVSTEKSGRMLQRIGLSDANGNNGTLDLDGLIAAVENFADQKKSDRNKGPLTVDETALADVTAWTPGSRTDRKGFHSAQIEGKDGPGKTAAINRNHSAQAATDKNFAAFAESSDAQPKHALTGQGERPCTAGEICSRSGENQYGAEKFNRYSAGCGRRLE